jgi:hypothetical protein
MRNQSFAKLVVAAALAIVSTATWAPPFGHVAPHPAPRPPVHLPQLHEPTPRIPPDSMPRPPGEHPFGVPTHEDPRQGGATNPVLEQARRAGAPDDVLQAVNAQSDQYASLDGLECCPFRAPWKDAINYSHRRVEEAKFAAAMRSEALDKASLQYLVISDSPHVNMVLAGDEGIPGPNRARTTSFESRASVEEEIDFMASRFPGEMIELYLLAKHEDRQVLLPNGIRIAAEELREYARRKGILLNFWGCETGLTESAGVKQSFDVRPLVKAIGKVIRSEGAATRANYLNSIHADTGLEFTFDVLAHNEAKRLVSAAIYEQAASSSAKPDLRDTPIGTFELPFPKSYSPVPTLASGNGATLAVPSAAPASQADRYTAGPTGRDAGKTNEDISAIPLLGGLAGLGVVLYLVGARRLERIRASLRR